ncbi:glycosyltransferase family 2 protein [Aurantiacibacter gilvus]|uniref:Glycosyltransferase family 2 protein n=1 Tax=Aurantiacibacter gilvus TaxID=3139141 RepID=A0ABU9ICT6_9SPHN
MSRIDLLLATYNGAKYLPEQLASLATQTHGDWRLLVRDDGSSDDTLDVVRAWSETVSQPVEIVEDGRKGLGASLNFAALLEKSDAPYFAFCDQDDAWLPEKLEVMLRAIRSEESRIGEDASVLAFSDLLVVDDTLTQVAPSFWEISRIDPAAGDTELCRLMARNCVTGCASLGNAALRETGLPIPAGARMHDWWLAMVASAFGSLVPVHQPTIRYRQHGGNVVGAADSRSMALVGQAVSRPRFYFAKALAARDNSQRQARAFAERFGDQLPDEERALVEGYGALADQGFLARKAFMLRHRVGAGSPLFRLALLAIS